MRARTKKSCGRARLVVTPLLVAGALSSQVARGDSPPLDERFGASASIDLLESKDASLVRLGAIRAGNLRDAASLGLLIGTIARTSPMRRSPYVVVEAARALARRKNDVQVRDALISSLSSATEAIFFEPEAWAASTRYAIELEAYALARCGDHEAVEALGRIADLQDEREAAAETALSQLPFGASVGAIPWTLQPELLAHRAVAAAAARHGDARAIPRLRAAFASEHEPRHRAKWLLAWAASGDPAVLDAAHELLTDRAGELRAAAVRVVAEHGSTQRDELIAGLILEKETALAGLELAARFPSRDATRAAIALLTATSDVPLRRLSLEALAEQVSDEAAAHAKLFTQDAAVGIDAYYALARSKSAAALGALESLAKGTEAPRSLVRAYLTRQRLFGDKSVPLDLAATQLSESKLENGAGQRREVTVLSIRPGFPKSKRGEMPLGELYDRLRLEPDAFERRALLGALAPYASTPVVGELVKILRETDPDERVRALAAQLTEGAVAQARSATKKLVLWVRTSLSPEGQPAKGGELLREDGPTVPFVFDDDGVVVLDIETAGDTRIKLTYGS